MEPKKKLPPLSDGTSERLSEEIVQQSVGCRHQFVLSGYEAVCGKCRLGLFVRNYQDFLDLTDRANKA